MRPTRTWAGSSLRPRAAGRSGGAVACARLGRHTGGKRQSKVAPRATTAPTVLAWQCVPATTWPTTTQRWQPSGIGGPMGKGHQRLLRQAAMSRQPGGVASVGTDGAPLCPTEHGGVEHGGVDAPSVPVKLVARRQGSPASALEPRTCWPSGTGRPMRNVAGTQSRSLWARTRRCTGLCEMSASWAWCTDGRHHQIDVLS